MENENGTLTEFELSSIAESITDGGTDEQMPCGQDISAPQTDGEQDEYSSERAERAEYERLIRTRFKQFYTDDTQKMINKRFKRYKAMEQRLNELEQRSQSLEEREAELCTLLESERERIERETEQRVMAGVLANRRRPSENGYAPKRAASPIDVSTLTKSQRAEIAKRAFGGEKISF